MSAYLEMGARWVLAGVFLVSLISKLRSRAAYAGFVAATRSLTAISSRRAAMLALPTVAAEIGTVVALLLGPVGLLMAIALLGCFTVALAAALRRGDSGPCRCFGATDTPIGAHHVIRNIVLMVVAATGWIAASVPSDGSLDPAILAVTAFGVAIVVLISTRLEDIVDVLR